MMLYKIIGIAMSGAVLSQLLKKHIPELSMTIPILTVVLITGMCLPYLETVFKMFKDIGDRAGIDASNIGIILKMTGVAYICQFAADICSDAGERAIAGKIELGGKIILITLSMPIVYSLLSIVSRIISF